MSWQLRIGKDAKKSILRFPREYRRRILSALEELPLNTYEGDIEKIKGEDNVWRRRIGDYRILYEIDALNKVISVRDIRRRTSKTY